ncbi:MAG: hypothetical protein LUQ25_05160 [Methanoregulaceae archaeon]|nr:hypothetical protein [Methanoregulaceae archaeon]
MQAPLQWVLSHTARFYGVVTLTIGDGEGFILIDLGKPIAYVFWHGGRILKGHGAHDYFLGQPLLDLSFRRYSPVEFEEALEFCYSNDILPRTGSRTIPSGIEGADKQKDETGIIFQKEIMEDFQDPGEVDVELPASPRIPPPGNQDLENLGHVLLGQVISLPYVQGVSIFYHGENVLSFGGVHLESLVILAEDMLQTAKEISTVADTGDFVHLTLQTPDGSLIIAPYFDEYLCILTTPEVNLGQIRKILREMHAGQSSVDKENEE